MRILTIIVSTVPDPVRVVAADAAAGLRMLLPYWLEADGDIRLLAAVGTGAELRVAVARHAPDVVLVDLRLPDAPDLPQLVGALRDQDGVRIAVLAGLPQDAAASAAEDAGADAGLPKASEPEAMRALVHRLAQAGRADRPAISELTLETSPAAAAEARDFVERQLRGHTSPNTVGNAKIIASELVTNAVLHGEGPPRLRITRSARRLRLEVVDDGSGQAPAIRDEGAEATAGQGLSVVEGLSVRWGAFEGTTHVWAELDPRA